MLNKFSAAFLFQAQLGGGNLLSEVNLEKRGGNFVAPF
jgi:hypothetical protein